MPTVIEPQQEVEHEESRPADKGRKRYHLELPGDLYDELQLVADENMTNVATLIRNYLKLGLYVESIKRNPDADLYIKEGDSLREIVLVY